MISTYLQAKELRARALPEYLRNGTFQPCLWRSQAKQYLPKRVTTITETNIPTFIVNHDLILNAYLVNTVKFQDFVVFARYTTRSSAMKALGVYASRVRVANSNGSPRVSIQWWYCSPGNGKCKLLVCFGPPGLMELTGVDDTEPDTDTWSYSGKRP